MLEEQEDLSLGGLSSFFESPHLLAPVESSFESQALSLWPLHHHWATLTLWFEPLAMHRALGLPHSPMAPVFQGQGHEGTGLIHRTELQLIRPGRKETCGTFGAQDQSETWGVRGQEPCRRVPSLSRPFPTSGRATCKIPDSKPCVVAHTYNPSSQKLRQEDHHESVASLKLQSVSEASWTA